MSADGPLATLSDEQARLLRPAPREPGSAMLATLTDRRRFGEDWILERKLDGYRALASRAGDGVRLLSRSGNPLGTAFPEIVDALEAQRCRDFTVDGEIVALAGDVTDFSLLQQRAGITKPQQARASRITVTYFVFDLLRLDGMDTTRLPLLERKALLREAVRLTKPLRYTTHRRATGTVDAALSEACSRGWEGLIAKRSQGAYVHRRSPDWLKLKCSRDQEFVIGGFTEPSGSRVGFGALLLGYHENGRLRYAGKVGTGWDTRTLRGLREALDTLVRERSPFDGVVRERAVHWLEPVLVAQIAFTEWTRDGMLRHPRFLGLRDDKPAPLVVREEPVHDS
jgi:DNA ligase D-like protein (predicted ligase)